MSLKQRHNVTKVGLMLRFALFISFTIFCFAATEITSQLSDNNYKFQMYEEEETHDSDEDNSSEDDPADKFKESHRLVSKLNITRNPLVKIDGKSSLYKGFEHEIPDPPPEV